MARLTVEGLDGLIEDFEELVKMGDDMILDILNAEAEVVEKAQKDKIRKLDIVDSGQLADSIRKTEKLQIHGGSKAIYVFPQGTRSDGQQNSEIGFIHEFGAPSRNIPAKNWMKKANEECTEEAIAAAQAAYDRYLQSKNL